MRGGVGDRHRRPVEIRAYAERVEFWQEGKIVGKHARAFGRDKAIYDPLHYIPVLACKPGALRNGAPFKDWDLPPAMRRIQRQLGRVPNGDRQMADVLCAVLIDGLGLSAVAPQLFGSFQSLRQQPWPSDLEIEAYRERFLSLAIGLLGRALLFVLKSSQSETPKHGAYFAALRKRFISSD